MSEYHEARWLMIGTAASVFILSLLVALPDVAQSPNPQPPGPAGPVEL